MYLSFFGLQERPFDLTPNPRFLVVTAAHAEALSNLKYGIASRRGITVLIGEAGTGKTTVIRTALQQQSEQVHCVHLHNPALSRSEFVEMLAVQFRLTDRARHSKAALLTELEGVLRERLRLGHSSVLIIDEAQSVPTDLLEEVRLLGNIETEETKLLSIVLAGQPELGTILNREELRQLKQRIALRCELRPLTQSETAGYLAGRIRAAGGVGAQVFTREAVLMIHERSRGIPRTISVIADNALVTAFAMGRKPVNSAVIAEVCQDLDLRGAAHETEHRAMPHVLVAPAAHEPVPPPAPVLSTEPPATADDEPAAGGDGDTGLFVNFSPKRRRFSLFTKSGAR